MINPSLAALRALRKHLLSLAPTGVDGFEGLAADALADLSGLVIRLAKSGLQSGRDASSAPGAAFAVALEGKLYRDKLRLEALAGKAVVAGHVMHGAVDVWALGTTSEVGDETAAKLADILEDKGVTLLILDWAGRPLPPLAVLLAAAKAVTLRFFEQHVIGVGRAALAETLDVIAADPAFRQQAEQLNQGVSATRVGLDALRRKSAEWLRARLRDRHLSQQTFGQYVSVAEPAAPAQPRTALARTLAALVVVDPSDVPLVVVLGDEGVGKTWLVAQWWAALPCPPILVMVAGRRADLLQASQPLESLAHLLADQDGVIGEAELAAWRRRLTRWKGQGASDQLRFVIVLDGLNERAVCPWADLIRGLAREAQLLGGIVLVTAREAYWNRDVLPMLGNTLAMRSMRVGEYSDEELAAVLAAKGHAPADLPANVREFVRNPRVCSVALGLLSRLAQPNELTKERLLVEYWQTRVAERGNGLVHNINDFDKLLRNHARAWREHPRRAFDRDAWAEFSGAARRLGSTTVLNDLTEIEEGRFLTVSSTHPNAYEFRRETLPYALGLLINDEINEELQRGSVDATEALDRILDVVPRI